MHACMHVRAHAHMCAHTQTPELSESLISFTLLKHAVLHSEDM